MKLSSSHSRVALFDTPADVELEADPYDKGAASSTFMVGPFEYEATFTLDPLRPRVYEYVFDLIDIHADGEELREILERVWREEIPPEQVDYYRQRLIGDGTGTLGTGNASQVLGYALEILKRFIATRHPYCVSFSSAESNRSRVFEKMIRSAFPGVKIEMIPREGGMDFYLYPRVKKRR